MVRLDVLEPLERAAVNTPSESTIGVDQAPEPKSTGLVEARLERWLVSLLDGKDPSEQRTRSTSEVIEALGNFSWLRQSNANWNQDEKSVEMAKGTAKVERARLKVTRHPKGIAIVRLLVTSLLRENDLEELGEALDCIVLSGTRCVLINFASVEKMSSQVVAHIAALQRQCLESGEGRVALCGLRPMLAELFEITGLSANIPVYEDEKTALESAWPEPAGPAPLPVAILAALRRRDRADESGHDAVDDAIKDSSTVDAYSGLALSADSNATEAWLILLSGPKGTRGRAVAISREPLVIGRDESCSVRSDYPGLSRLHAQLECKNGRVVVRDLGSTNGTVIKGRILRGESAALRDGARVAIGPLRFAVAINRPLSPGPFAEETIVEWLRASDDDEVDTREQSEGDTRFDLPRFGDDAATFETLRATVIEGVCVATPRRSKLDGDPFLDNLRQDLLALTQPPWPRRLVVNMVSVDHISTQSVGILLAHAMGLERAGGSLRLCQVNPRVLAVFERIKLPQLLETYNALDDAVLTRWPE